MLISCLWVIFMSYTDTWCSLESAFMPSKTTSLGLQEKNLQIACKISLQFLNACLNCVFSYWNWSIRDHSSLQNSYKFLKKMEGRTLNLQLFWKTQNGKQFTSIQRGNCTCNLNQQAFHLLVTLMLQMWRSSFGFAFMCRSPTYSFSGRETWNCRHCSRPLGWKQTWTRG